jgi:hypothetical protein
MTQNPLVQSTLLTYDTARKMFDRANDAAATGWTLHSLRHTAAYRLERRGVASDATFRRRCEAGRARVPALPDSASVAALWPDTPLFQGFPVPGCTG